MGRLSGFKYRKIIKVLKEFEFEFHRQAAGSHEICGTSKTMCNCFSLIITYASNIAIAFQLLKRIIKIYSAAINIFYISSDKNTIIYFCRRS